MKEEKSKASRRTFFGKGVLAGLALFGLGYSKKIAKQQEETVKMLTPDGRLVEVEKRNLPPVKNRRISNRELYEWMHKKI